MRTSMKATEWLTCFSVEGLILGCYLFKNFEKFDEYCSLLKAAVMSSANLR